MSTPRTHTHTRFPSRARESPHTLLADRDDPKAALQAPTATVTPHAHARESRRRASKKRKGCVG
eukprot:4679586-Alexandrium_andersonii.AAC.1